MKFSLSLLTSLIVSSGLAYTSNLKNYGGVSGSTPGKFDYYLLAEIWTPLFCEHSGCSNAECADISANSDYGATHFIVHGLWPQFNDIIPRGEQGCQSQDGCVYPQFCSKEISQFNVNNLPAGANEHAPAWFYGLGEHEWEKHGSCADAMNLDLSTDQAQRVYFNTTYDAFSRKKEFVVTSSIGKSVPAKELYDKLEFSSGLGCTPKCELEALFTCWSKDSQNLPLQQIPCPAVGIINSEYSNGCQKCTEITIPEFPCSNDNQLF